MYMNGKSYTSLRGKEKLISFSQNKSKSFNQVFMKLLQRAYNNQFSFEIATICLEHLHKKRAYIFNILIQNTLGHMPYQDRYVLQSRQSIQYAFSIDMNAYILLQFSSCYMYNSNAKSDYDKAVDCMWCAKELKA